MRQQEEEKEVKVNHTQVFPWLRSPSQVPAACECVCGCVVAHVPPTCLVVCEQSLLKSRQVSYGG